MLMYVGIDMDSDDAVMLDYEGMNKVTLDTRAVMTRSCSTVIAGTLAQHRAVMTRTGSIVLPGI